MKQDLFLTGRSKSLKRMTRRTTKTFERIAIEEYCRLASRGVGDQKQERVYDNTFKVSDKYDGKMNLGGNIQWIRKVKMYGAANVQLT